MLNLDNESYYGLDAVGTRLWELLTANKSIDDACRQMLDEYDVDGEQLRQDVRKLMDELLEQGLIRVENKSLA